MKPMKRFCVRGSYGRAQIKGRHIFLEVEMNHNMLSKKAKYKCKFPNYAFGLSHVKSEAGVGRGGSTNSDHVLLEGGSPDNNNASLVYATSLGLYQPFDG
jgi:hypothetical protein